uniref:C-type lectin domain-containing protein n=1 Tax=Paramormyrops kingsleyae TaxID=1676925 RepID=A0A3B3RTS7_9TELE
MLFENKLHCVIILRSFTIKIACLMLDTKQFVSGVIKQWGHCYFFSMGREEELTWQQSVDFCTMKRGNLTIIENRDEMMCETRKVSLAHSCLWTPLTGLGVGHEEQHVVLLFTSPYLSLMMSRVGEPQQRGN